VGFAGDKCKDYSKHKEDLKQCLVGRGFRDVAVECVGDVRCDEQLALEPSKRGDCFAMAMSSFDIGIVWTQGLLNEATFEQKPPQRLVNFLATGVPVVAHRKYAGHRQVASAAGNSTALAANADELCHHVASFAARSPARREEDAREALQVAAGYSLDNIGQLYLAELRGLVAASPLASGRRY